MSNFSLFPRGSLKSLPLLLLPPPSYSGAYIGAAYDIPEGEHN